MNAEVDKRIDIFANALFHEMRVEERNDLDLRYTPALSSPWDLLQQSSQEWMRYRTRTRRLNSG